VKWNIVKWNVMEQNEINISFHYFDILKRRETKLIINGDMRWNSFYLIPLLFFKSKQWNISIIFHSTPLNFIIFYQSKRSLKNQTFEEILSYMFLLKVYKSIKINVFNSETLFIKRAKQSTIIIKKKVILISVFG
jgi:hypothetical protein